MTDSFFDKVHHLARQIPFGRVSTYGAIAKKLGMARSARMVGWAMNASHNLDDIPAHRVVNRVGLLSGKHHFEGTNLMQQLLESEGIKVKNNQVVDFEKVFGMRLGEKVGNYELQIMNYELRIRNYELEITNC